MKKIDWTQLKTFSTLKNISLQYVIDEYGHYMIYLIDGSLQLQSRVLITNPRNDDQIDFEDNYKNTANSLIKIKTEVQESPFKVTTLPNGKKVFRRVHGISAIVSGEVDFMDFVIPYPQCRITGIEVMNGNFGDKVNLKVFDNQLGTISGVPNALLDQFGFDVFINEGYHKSESNYGADLIMGIRIRVEYDAINSDLLPKTVYINFFLHEIKDPIA